MTRVDAFFRQVSAWPLQKLGAAYVGLAIFCQVLFSLQSVLLWVGVLVALVALVALFVLVTWYRDDDILAAGVLLAVITGIAILAQRLLGDVIAAGRIEAIGGVILSIPAGMVGLMLRAVIGGVIGAGIVWVARKIKPPVVVPRPVDIAPPKRRVPRIPMG